MNAPSSDLLTYKRKSMIKKLLGASIIISALLFTGCSDDKDLVLCKKEYMTSSMKLTDFSLNDFIDDRSYETVDWSAYEQSKRTFFAYKDATRIQIEGASDYIAYELVELQSGRECLEIIYVDDKTYFSYDQIQRAYKKQ